MFSALCILCECVFYVSVCLCECLVHVDRGETEARCLTSILGGNILKSNRYITRLTDLRNVFSETLREIDLAVVGPSQSIPLLIVRERCDHRYFEPVTLLVEGERAHQPVSSRIHFTGAAQPTRPLHQFRAGEKAVEVHFGVLDLLYFERFFVLGILLELD